MGRVYVVGSINQDCVATVDRLPGPGETVAGTSLSDFQGGKGANQAVAASRMGAQVCFVGRVGEDAAGARLVARLQAEGIDAEVSIDACAPTGTALIVVDAAGENSIVVIAGANGTLSPAHCDAITGIAKGDVLLLQNEIPAETNRQCAARARGRGGRVVLNAAPARRLDSAELADLDLLVVNEHELGHALGEMADTVTECATRAPGDHEAVGSALLDCARRAGLGVVLTLGAAGAVAAVDGRIIATAAPAAAAVDTTGAGDCFAGALGAALASGAALEPALRDAAAAASLSVTRPGAAVSFPTRADLVPDR